MIAFREKVTHSVDRVFSLHCLFLIQVISRFGFEGRISVLRVEVWF